MQNARDNLTDIMASRKMHGTISRTLWLHANCMGQSRGHYGFMQIAWNNFADIMASCKLHGTISQTLRLHAKCMGQSRGRYGFMQNAWDNLADILVSCKMHGTISRTLRLHANLSPSPIKIEPGKKNYICFRSGNNLWQLSKVSCKTATYHCRLTKVPCHLKSNYSSTSTTWNPRKGDAKSPARANSFRLGAYFSKRTSEARLHRGSVEDLYPISSFTEQQYKSFLISR